MDEVASRTENGWHLSQAQTTFEYVKSSHLKACILSNQILLGSKHCLQDSLGSL